MPIVNKAIMFLYSRSSTHESSLSVTPVSRVRARTAALLSMASILHSTHHDTCTLEPASTAGKPGVLLQVGGEMHEKLGFTLARDSLVRNSRLNVT